MKVMRIGIKSMETMFEDAKKAIKAARKKTPFKRQIGTYFTSLEAARNFLTPRRLEILKTIKEKKPESIYELAKLLRRSFSSVLRDIQTLERHGLVKLPRNRRSVRNAVLPKVPYDAINLWIGL